MTEIFEEKKNKALSRRAPRVSYTINNSQPVICTIIGDHPLFYMSYEESSEEEYDAFEALHSGHSGILEEEMMALKNEIVKLDQLSATFARTTNDKIADFIHNKEHLTHQHAKDSFRSMETLLDVLAGSRLAKAYLDCAKAHKISLQYSDQIETSYYDRQGGLILIHPALNETDRLLLLVQELRRHWQHRQGVLIHPLMFHPDNAVLINRLQMADLMVSVVRVSWELQLSGEKVLWERLENSSLSDLARAFAREAFFDFRTINNGQACAAVFESWFLSERCRIEDKNLIQQMLADYKGYIFDLQMAEHMITPALISAMGQMPFGKNYLAEHAITIMNDPVFTEIRDRSNANFLWFIKFERSFKETEQKLQSSHNPSTEDGHLSVYYTKKQDLRDETGRAGHTADSGQIIPFFPEQSLKPNPSHTGPVAEGSNVVYLRHTHGES